MTPLKVKFSLDVKLLEEGKISGRSPAVDWRESAAQSLALNMQLKCYAPVRLYTLQADSLPTCFTHIL
jgi:hypothetical protein